MKKFLLSLGLILMGFVGMGQTYSLTGSNPVYTQNFDGLPTTVSPGVAWTDNTTLPNWYLTRSGTAPFNIIGGTGSSNTGALYSFASASAPTDRALGSVSSATPSTLNYGINFTNNSPNTINSITVNYTGEQWRDGGAATPVAQTLSFSYKVNAAAVNDAGFTGVSALDFVTPTFTNTGSGVALDGNASANRTVKNATFTVSVPVGSTIFIRWQDINDTGNDHGLAVDDLSITFDNAPLPITLISFKANITESQQTVLKWATASEKDNDYFEVERSKNALDFESIGKIKGRGTVELRNDYTFTDETPLKGINYYRLKQVDFDGQYSYTRAESVIRDGDGTISLFPNPTANTLKINFEDTEQIENTTIYNLMGRVVKTISGNQGKYEIRDLPQGQYILQIGLSDGRIIRNSFVKN
jgi:hypothetical protein